VDMLILVGVLLGIGVLLLPAIQGAREAARRADCIGQCKFIGMDTWIYHEQNHRFPAAYLADEDGQPAHSWRVTLLGPEFDELYEQYRYDESWDSPRNRDLASGLPVGMSQVYPWYHCPSDRDCDRYDTSYVMAVGSDAYSPGPAGRTIAEFRAGGSSLTIAIAEMSESDIPWMEPRDLDCDTMSYTVNNANGSGIRSEHPGVVNALFADSTVRSLGEDIDPEVLKSLFKVSGPKDLSGWGDY